MPNHVDPICSTLDFTRKRTTFGGVYELWRRISYKVASAFGYSSEFLGFTESNHLAAMASAIPIDISSSDSDLDLQEIDNYKDESPLRDTSSSANVRVLPHWATSTHSNVPGNNGLSRRDPSFSSSKRHIVHDEISPRPHKHSRIPEIVGASSSRARHNLLGQTNGSNNVDRMDASHGIQSSSLPMKRSLPAYLQPSSSGLHSNNLVENVGTSQFREIQGRSFASLSHPSMHEIRGNRLLPPSILTGKYPSTSAFGGSNDALNYIGEGEERPPEADERYVFQAAVHDLHQPKLEANLPNGLLSVSLLRHQKIALAWMLGKESSGLCLGGILADDQGLGKTVSMIALMLMQKSLESKRKRKESCSSTTEPLNLDDDGESVVALDKTNQIKESADLAVLPQASNVRPKRPTAGTLIVCPASVVRQWSRELDEKVADGGRLSVLIYHGGQRTKIPSVLAKYDAVLTTYAIVANEVPKQPLVDDGDGEQKDGERYGISAAFTMEKKRKKSSKKSKKGKDVIDLSAIDSSSGALAKVNWSRVILDESQTIKNHRTQVARACCSLRAKRRWCLSGTPIQNSIDELFSYFRFLRYDPYDKYKVFGSSIKALISRDSVKGYKKLQVVLRNIMLRRTKGTLIEGQPIINLPPKRVDLTKVDFSIEERNFYNQLEADSRKQFKAYAAAGTVNQNYANILLMLLRLRQACDHPLLIKGLTSNPVGKVSTDMAKMLPRELLVNLLKQLETSLAICLVCRDPPENAVVTMCGHVFCYQCVSDNLTGEDNTCPAPECKEHLGADVVFSRSTLRRCLSDDNDGDSPITYEPSDNSMVLKTEYISSKIKSALDILNTHCVWRRQISEFYDDEDDERRGPEKAIVFSQWTSMLDLVEMSFKNNCINYRRLDGTMTIAARDKGVKEFNTDPEVDVMLMSLKAGNLGLNMVAASRVILLDLWWNPTTEDQAIDRAHRIGQTRPVTVSRLTIKDTVEDRILSLQEDKRKMVASAFGEDQSGGRGSRLTVDDLRFLFEGSNASRR